MTLGDNIRRRREALAITKAELGRRAGVSEVCISYWERGVIQQVGHLRLLDLAAALGCTVSELLDDPALAQRDAAVGRYAELYNLVGRLLDAVWDHEKDDATIAAVSEAKALLGRKEGTP